MSDPYDVARYIFINEEGEFRSGWRALAFLICFIVVALFLTSFVNALASLFPSLAFLVLEPSGSESNVIELIQTFVSNMRNLVAATVSSVVCARGLERRGFASIGFRLHKGWARDFALGSLMGAASLAIAVGIAAGVSAVTFDVHITALAPLVRGLLIVSSFFIIAAATEELIFRGFPFQAIVHNLGGSKAVAITSLIFGLAHLSNPNASLLSTINTCLAGVWLGVAYLVTRNLWLATGLHWSWNFAMVFIFGLPVSGFTTLNRLAWLRGSTGEPTWISGGSYGPEAGLAATIALILSTVTIWKSGLFSASKEMLVAIRHGKRQPAYVSVTQVDSETSERTGEPQLSDREQR
jgi:membrane protease YdiL (CAAX protease family)